MALASLGNVLKFSRGESLDSNESGDLVKEVLLMTLARATKSDSRVAPVEVSTVRKIIREATGDDISEADIRVAASSELFESSTLEVTLSGLRDVLTSAKRAFIAKALADVIRSDAHISEFELDYFDSVAQALQLRPSEIAGLRPQGADAS